MFHVCFPVFPLFRASPKQFTVWVLNAFLVCLRSLECCVRLAGLVFLLSSSWSWMLCPSSGFVSLLVSRLVSHLVSLCPPLWACLRSCLPGLVSHLVFHLVFHRPSGNKKNKSKLHEPLLQLFGVYGWCNLRFHLCSFLGGGLCKYIPFVRARWHMMTPPAKNRSKK